MSGLRVASLSIGDELLYGRHPDLDAPIAAKALGELGVGVGEVRVLPDDLPKLVAALRELSATHDLVITSGGLGPTLDDLTRHAVAEAFGRPLSESPVAWGQIEAWYANRDRMPPESNRRQALVPEGAEVLENRAGTAPGLWLDLDAHTAVAVLPGPPREFESMLEDQLLPRLRRRLPDSGGIERREFSLFGLPESVFAERAGSWMDREARPRMGVSARNGQLVVSLSDSGSDARESLDAREAEFRGRFGAHLFADRDARLEEVLGAALLERGARVTVAESCTGGRVAGALTRVPGISAVLEESFVTYSNRVKAERLGVPEDVLRAHGAVSSEVAAAMALGALRVAGADLALSVTGIAGPDGGSDAKPVGTVWFGVAHGGDVWTALRAFPPAGRDRIRAFAEQTALFLGWAALEGKLSDGHAELVSEGR